MIKCVVQECPKDLDICCEECEYSSECNQCCVDAPSECGNAEYIGRERKPAAPDPLPTIKDSGQRSEFPTGAVRDMSEGKGRMDLLPWNAIIEVSKHCEEGAKKYGENNVDKGIPMHSLADSAMRHMAKFIAGHKDEDHLRAAAWNILWALEFRETRPELNDLYYWKGEDQCSETDATIAE